MAGTFAQLRETKMAAGLSQSAINSRRRRFLARVARVAASDGLEVSRPERGVLRVGRPGGEEYAVGMKAGRMSNGATVLEHYITVWSKECREERTFTSWTWLPRNAPSAGFWLGLDRGRWDTSGMLAEMD